MLETMMIPRITPSTTLMITHIFALSDAAAAPA
jgi:hypothetical protein